MAPRKNDNARHRTPQDTTLVFHNKRAWRLVDAEYEDAVLNLAVEEAIMEKVGQGESPNTVRLWTNPKPTIVVGKFQIPELEVNKEACKRHGVLVLRRFTGGGTVYHDKGNLNYAISARRDDPIIPQTVDKIRPTLCAGIVEALRILGVNAKFEPKEAYIHVKGKKISGTAALATRSIVFLHGTLLVNSDLTILREVLDVPPYPKDAGLKRFVKSIRKEVTSIQEQMAKEVSVGDVKEALTEGLRKVLGIELQRGEISDSELEVAKQIVARRRDGIIISGNSQ
jgi:lipoate-protein ligase A